MNDTLIQLAIFLIGSGISALICIPITKKKAREELKQEKEKSKQQQIETEKLRIASLKNNIDAYSEIINNLDDKCVTLLRRTEQAEKAVAIWENKYNELSQKYESLKSQFENLQKKYTKLANKLENE